MLLVSGCPILLSSLGGSGLMYLMIPVLLVHCGSAWVAAYFKHMILKNCFVLGQSAEAVHCSRSKENTWGNVLLTTYLLYAGCAREFIVSWIWRLLPSGAAASTRNLALQPIEAQVQVNAEGREVWAPDLGFTLNHMCLGFLSVRTGNDTSVSVVLLGG